MLRVRRFSLSKNSNGFCRLRPQNTPLCKTLKFHFTSTTKLNENSYSHWFKQTSRRLPSNFFQLKPKNRFTDVDNAQMDELRSLIKAQDYDTIMTDFFNHDPEFINFIIRQTLKPCPNLHIFDSECEIETLRYKSLEPTSKRLSIDNLFYKYIYSKIPRLYDFCKLYETMMFKNEVFFEYYIWLCYHMNDLPKLQSLAFGKNQYHYKTWGYLISAFIQNYEVEFAKSIFQKLCRHPLDGQLLEITLSQLIEVDALFENIVSIFECWTKHSLEVTPKALALISEQYYKFGTAQEIANFQELVKEFGYENHYRIKSVDLCYEIINKSKNYKKEITTEDLSKLSVISQSVETDFLPDFYYLWLEFFCKYSNLTMIQLIIAQLNEHNINFSDKYHQLVCQYYTDHGKFLQLLALIQSHSIPFNEVYLYNLFDSFVKTYPYHAPNFEAQLHQWIHNKNFNEEMKNRLIRKLTITKIQSQITPYNINSSPFIDNPRKYNSVFWKDIPWNSHTQGKFLKEQISYRINKGFIDILNKGVRPDSEVITKTFRRSDMNNKKIIIDLLKTMRTYDHNKIMYDLYILQGNQTKETLKKFYDEVKVKDLTLNNKIMFSRMLMNKGLHEETKNILASIDNEELDDKTKMVKFVIEVRNNVSYAKYEDIDQLIDCFPIDEVVLSPYILNQTVFIEKKLRSKLDYNKRHHKELDNSNLEHTISKLQGLIGDIDVRLDNDTLEIGKIIQKMFKFLDKWTAENKP